MDPPGRLRATTTAQLAKNHSGSVLFCPNPKTQPSECSTSVPLAPRTWSFFLNEPYVNEEGERRQALPSAPESSVRFVGAGSNIVYVDWEKDVVIVVRWIRGGLDEFIGKVLSSIEGPAPTDDGALR